MSGLEWTLTAMQAHLTAVAWPHYEVRLIDAARRVCCTSRYWTAAQLLSAGTVGFLRARNCQGCDVYFRPHAGPQSAGYLLLDFDAGPCPLAALRAAQHTPCIVVETSSGRQQAWLRVSTQTIRPSWATTMARHLAARYGADLASAEWRHLGRLAGFTNRKPARRQHTGLPPWVRVIWQCPRALAVTEDPVDGADIGRPRRPIRRPTNGVVTDAACLYQQALESLRLREHFPQPDWSIADYRVARRLLQRDLSMAGVAEVLRKQSPGFPRSHPDPEDYLRRTVHAAVASLDRTDYFSRAPSGEAATRAD